ncbi:MAG: hypothetical protein F4X59_03100 [Holophagales bacterium]|nr:hypothetical protein [Holophagales bacterium]MYC09098.1 hypothetical protein [Holophagales bacterium]
MQTGFRVPRFAPACVALLALAAGWACAVPSDRPVLDENDLETVAVGQPADSILRPDEDVQERRAPEAALRGRIPGAFPDRFPVPDASTVVDFGDVATEEGEPVTAEYVGLLLPLGAPDAREWLLREAQAAGWRATLGESMTFRRGEEWVVVVIEPGATPGNSAARFEYAKP